MHVINLAALADATTERTRGVTLCPRAYKEVGMMQTQRLATFFRRFKLSKKSRALKHSRGLLLQSLLPFFE
jgi:hypothetical protein